VEHCRRKRLGAGGLVAHRRLLEVPAAHLRAAVLAEHHVVGGERRDGLQHLELLGADMLGGERERLLLWLRVSSTLSFSVRMCSAERVRGCSIATRAIICSRWFCITSRMMPYWSK